MLQPLLTRLDELREQLIQNKPSYRLFQLGVEVTFKNELADAYPLLRAEIERLQEVERKYEELENKTKLEQEPISRDKQNKILERMLAGEATKIERLWADAITIAKYWDKIHPEMSYAEKCHFAFHSSQEFFLCTPKSECTERCPLYGGGDKV